MMSRRVMMMNLYNVEQFGEVTGKGSLFDDVETPTGIDQKILYDKIMYDNWDLEPYISDFDVLHRFILNWFKTRYQAWEMMNKALSQDYEPLENMNRTETETISRNRNVDGNVKTSNTISNKSSDTLTSEQKLSAFDSSTYQPSQMQDDSRTLNEDTSENGTEQRTDSEKESITNERNSHGTIGVITNQDMLQKEIDIRRYDIYSIISKEFTNEFMLLCM